MGWKRVVGAFCLLLFLLFVVGCGLQPQSRPPAQALQQETYSQEVLSMLENVEWLGHASFRLTGEKVIYIDPWKIKDGEPADIILITHEHYDHCSADDAAKILKDDTAIVTVADCQSKLSKLERPITLVEPGDKLRVKGVEIEAVPAYNVGKQFHPKENAWVGFIVNLNGKRIYHAGDTDFIPEMSNLKDIDVALLPIGGTYTMNAEEAAKAANTIKAKITVPMHFGDIIGSEQDAARFRSLVEGEVVVLSKK